MDSWIQVKVCDTSKPVCGITTADKGVICFTINDKYLYSFNEYEIEPKPTILAVASGSLQGIVRDEKNNKLHVCDDTYNHILTYAIDSKRFRVRQPNIDTPLNTPSGIVMDKNGDLIIADLHSIRKFVVAKGSIETIAGSKQASYCNGPVQKARFAQPRIATHENIIYVADSLNSCIRKIEDGIVTTIAGTPGIAGTVYGQLLDCKFYIPMAILVDRQGNLLVGDHTGIKKVDLRTKMVSPVRGVNLKKVTALYTENWDIVYVGVDSAIYKLVNTWRWKRYLWIGHLKGDPKECLLATLPKDTIKEISLFVAC